MTACGQQLAGIVVIQPQVWFDARGAFQELWHQQRYEQQGIPTEFVQDNLANSRSGVMRGLHFQFPGGQGKLIYVLQGEIFDVSVDIRTDSPTFGRWFGITLSQENRQQVYVPDGFAHGYLVTSGPALVAYKCTSFYAPACERVIAWDDPTIGIEWPTAPLLLSLKDQQARRLTEIPHHQLPSLSSGLPGLDKR